MVSNLTTQVRGVAQVVTAVADGDLNRKFTIEAKGEVAALAETVNAMVDRLRVFSAEVTRVAREVGSEGKLGGAAEVEGVSGVWRGLTESVNGMADNLTQQVRNIADVTTAVAQGDLTRKITVDAKGEILRAQEHDQHDGRPALARSPTRSRASPGRSAPRASSAARRR